MELDQRSGDSPMFSIVLPTHNAVAHLDITLSSLATQSSSLYELIVIDNKSQDGTVDKLLHHIRIHQWQACVLSEADTGVADAFNKGIQRARGRYLYFIGAGDRLRDRVLDSVTYWLNRDEVDVLCGDIHFSSAGRSACHQNLTPQYMARYNICHQAVFYLRSLFDRFGGYDVRYKSYSDYEFNLRVMFANGVKRRHIDLTIADYMGNGPSEFGDPFFEENREILICKYLGADVLDELYGAKQAQNEVIRCLNALVEQPETSWAIYGAGVLGRQLSIDQRIHESVKKKLAFFLDGDIERQGSNFMGRPILGVNAGLLTQDPYIIVAMGSCSARSAAREKLEAVGIGKDKILDWF